MRDARCAMCDVRCAMCDAGGRLRCVVIVETWGSLRRWNSPQRWCVECVRRATAPQATGANLRLEAGQSATTYRIRSPCFPFETIVWAPWYHITRNYKPAFDCIRTTPRRCCPPTFIQRVYDIRGIGIGDPAVKPFALPSSTEDNGGGSAPRFDRAIEETIRRGGTETYRYLIETSVRSSG